MHRREGRFLHLCDQPGGVTSAQEQHSLTLVTVGIAVVAAIVLTAAVSGAIGARPHSDPLAGLSDAQRQQLVDRAHQLESEWARDFLASGKDLRSLPPVMIEAWAAPETSLGEATAKADIVVHGQVERTEFVLSTDGALPTARSTVRILETGKGNTTAATLTLEQVGGPVLWANGGEGGLAYLDTDELVLGGDEVVLWLTREGGGYQAIPGRGVYFVREGRVVPARSNQFGIDLAGLTAMEVLARVRELTAK